MESPFPGPPYSPSGLPGQGHHLTGAPHLRLVESVDVDAVQRQLAKTPEFLSHPGVAYVDLMGATSFDLNGLEVLLAVVAERARAEGVTRFRLPSSEIARHALRMWRFPAAASVVARAPFRTLVDKHDLDYFGENWPLFPLIDTSPAYYLMSQKPFGLSAYTIADLHDLLQVMDQEVERWHSYAMVKLLKRLLPEKTVDDIARVVIQELVSNILQHHGATTVIIASRLDMPEPSVSPSFRGITIMIWDDGTSIIAALRMSLRRGVPIQAAVPQIRDIFSLQEGSWSTGRFVYSSDWIPDPGAPDPEILLASLYTGIEPLAGHKIPLSGGTAGPTITEGPEALLPLYRTVLNHFGGSIEIRSGTSAVTLTPNRGPNRYRVSLSMGTYLFPIRGNFVTVTLPAADV